MKAIYTLTIAIIIVWLSSCNKYVDDFRTKGNLTATGAITYRDLLNNTEVFEQTASILDFSGDDIEYADTSQERDLSAANPYTQTVQAYTWADQYYGINIPDKDWNRLYNLIYNCNTVTTELPLISDGTADYRNELLAEAMVHRADAYLQLVNMYGKTYTPATASTDFGVPLITQVTVVQNLTRNTVQEVYDQIIKDLNTAVQYLPQKSAYNTLPSKAAAYALLARTYLLMGNYKEALKNAQNALAIQSTVVDLNLYTTGSSYPARNIDPEIILSKTSERFTNGGAIILRLSDDLVNLLGTKDLRYQIFTRPASFSASGYTGRMYWKEIVTGDSRNTGPSVPEMMLISAECMARTNDAAGAVSVLNQLRQKRFAPADYIPYTATTPDAALSLALDERRRELFCHSYRWFDQKRLNTAPRFAKIETRTFLGQTYTLDPNGNRYYYPIANFYFQYNKFLVQNPR